MSEFDALLKRSFAEAHEPADDGFSVQVERAVARQEAVNRLRNGVQTAGLAIAGAAVLYGLYGMVLSFTPDIMTSVGFGVARARAVIGGGPAEDLMRSVTAMLPQIMLVVAALTGGAVAYRATQD